MFTQLIMLCPSLVDEGGHEYDYTNELALAAQEAKIAIKTYVQTTAKNLSLPGEVVYATPPDKLPQGIVPKFSALLQKFFFYWKVFGQKQTKHTLFFIHTISQKQLIVVALAWLFAGIRGHSLTLFLRHAVGQSLSDRVMIKLLGFASLHNVSCVTDSDLLAANLMPRMGCRVKVVPIPIKAPSQGTKRHNKQSICSYFGARRKNKGFQLLPTFLAAAEKENASLTFSVQAYEHRDVKPEEEVSKALAVLKQAPNVTVIDRILTGEEFGQLVFKSDIALLPYDSAVYTYSTSGNFVMSIIARSVVITTENTWMSHQAEQYKMTRVVLLPWPASPDHIAQAMQQAIKLLQGPDQPSGEETAWCAQQTPKRLWDIISETNL